MNLSRCSGTEQSTSGARNASHRGKGGDKQIELEAQEKTPFTKKRRMTWAQRLKRVFDIEECDICGKKVKVIASIEDPAVIKQILST